MTKMPKTPLHRDTAEEPIQPAEVRSVNLQDKEALAARGPSPELVLAPSLPALGPRLPNLDVFRASTSRITLAQVLTAAEAQLEGTALRDTRSAFATLTRAGVNLGGTVATAANVRTVLDALSPGQLGTSEKRLANIRSLVSKAVEQFGQRRTWVTKEIPLSGEWEAFLGQVTDQQHRWALGRLACYCTVQGTGPHAVTVETLLGFHAALEAEEIVKDPRNLLKHTIAVWNMCHSRVPGWPDTRLSSPFKTAPAMLPLEAFPESFQADVAAWEERMRHPDPLDLTAPVRALREPTLQGYRFAFRRLASALVRAGVAVEAITGLEVLVQLDHFRTALREYLPGKGQVKSADYAHKMAVQMLTVARVHLGFDEVQLKPIKAMADRIKPQGGRRMGERNRKRLEQFDDPAAVQRLLHFPEEELARALKLRNLLRRAKGMERALAISLAIFTGLRVKNLRMLHMEQNLQRRGGRVFVQFPDDQMKTHRSLELELPRDTIALLDLFLAEHRPLLPGSAGPFLFPGEEGGPRSYSAMRDALGRMPKKLAGILLSPHLYRHITAKLVIERRPELALDVSRRLGHKSLSTTYQSYLGTEGPAASRRINDLLQKVRDKEGGK